MNTQSLAQVLQDTRLNRQESESLRTEYPFNLDEAYLIQEAGLKLREAVGEKRIGVKLGFTSKAKMEQMGVNHLIWGGLTDVMQVKDGGELDLSQFIHPRIEPEIGFITSKDITTALHIDNCLEFVGSVFAAMEIIDSRYQAFKFSLEDVVADNTSSAAFVIGALLPASTFTPFADVSLSENGVVIETGNTEAILGHPLRALIQISELLAARGQNLPKGSFILAGAATAARALQAGCHYQAEVAGLGCVSITTKGT